jgi:hypothetical protein
MCSSTAVPAAARAPPGMLLRRLAAQSNNLDSRRGLPLATSPIGMRPAVGPKNNDRPAFPLVIGLMEPPRRNRTGDPILTIRAAAHL